MATSRIDMRIDEVLKSSAEKAAALKGMKSLTEYVVRLIEEDAKKLFANMKVWLLRMMFLIDLLLHVIKLNNPTRSFRTPLRSPDVSVFNGSGIAFCRA